MAVSNSSLRVKVCENDGKMPQIHLYKILLGLFASVDLSLIFYLISETSKSLHVSIHSRSLKKNPSIKKSINP